MGAAGAAVAVRGGAVIDSLGIVGHGADKFTPHTEALARAEIRGLIRGHAPRVVVSGESPVGGIDIWTREEAHALRVPFEPKAPLVNEWDPPNGGYGFKARNLDIAKCDLVVCIVVRELPPGYRGRRFDGCYHCMGRNPAHVKSGGCWTAWKSARPEWIILP